MLNDLQRELHLKLLIYSIKSWYKNNFWDFSGFAILLFGGCCCLSSISDNLLPTVLNCDNWELISISDNLFAVLLALSIANVNNSFLAFLALIASVSVLTGFWFFPTFFFQLSLFSSICLHIFRLLLLVLVFSLLVFSYFCF